MVEREEEQAEGQACYAGPGKAFKKKVPGNSAFKLNF